MKLEYKTFAYLKKGKGPRAWDDFLNNLGLHGGWQLVFTQELATRRNCTFVRPTTRAPDTFRVRG